MKMIPGLRTDHRGRDYHHAINDYGLLVRVFVPATAKPLSFTLGHRWHWTPEQLSVDPCPAQGRCLVCSPTAQLDEAYKRKYHEWAARREYIVNK